MSFLEELDNIIKQRKIDLPEQSYTTTLFKQGDDRILRKVIEEAGEFIIAVKNKDITELKNEAADLLFHVMVALRNQGVGIDDVINILKERHK